MPKNKKSIYRIIIFNFAVIIKKKKKKKKKEKRKRKRKQKIIRKIILVLF